MIPHFDQIFVGARSFALGVVSAATTVGSIVATTIEGASWLNLLGIGGGAAAMGFLILKMVVDGRTQVRVSSEYEHVLDRTTAENEGLRETLRQVEATNRTLVAEVADWRTKAGQERARANQIDRLLDWARTRLSEEDQAFLDGLMQTLEIGDDDSN